MKKLSRKLLSLILIFILVFTFVHTFFIKSKADASSATPLDASYTQYVKSGINAFPESYQKKLAYLKYLHPNWEFKAYYTGISWDQVTSSLAENKCGKNTIYKSDVLDPQILCKCGSMGDVGYYCASGKIVNYYLDPRNFLGEAMVFQFMDLSDGSGITRDAVARTVSGTYLSGYVDDIMAAANDVRINPLHIVATIFQEMGKKSEIPKAITGTVPGYENCYNFYNYGATDGAGAVERGLAKARELGWTTPRKALAGGAQILANEYIYKGQTTKYFYKFDVVGNEIVTETSGQRNYSKDRFFSHQYMTNLRDPSSQAGSLYDTYVANGIIDTGITFTIPVYNNMPSTPIEFPTSLPSSSLCEVKCMKDAGVSLRKTPGGASYGTLIKGTPMVRLGTSGSWTQVKIIRATSFTAGSGWNGEEIIGYMSSEYVGDYKADVPDYRGVVDMGAGGVTPGVTIQPGEAEFKADDGNNQMAMTPATKMEDVKKQYAGAVFKKSDGTVITDSSEYLGTGSTITVGEKVYTVVKYGDLNGDGFVDTGDTFIAKKAVMGITTLDSIWKTAADVNKDTFVDTGDTFVLKKEVMGIPSINL